MNEDLARDFLLEGFPNPERKGCPDENTLRALADDRLPPEHPARFHLGSCSECFAEYRHYRQDLQEQASAKQHHAESSITAIQMKNLAAFQSGSGRFTPSRWQLWTLAASLAVLLYGGFAWYRYEHRLTSPAVSLASAQPIDATVDLLEAGTVRGSSDGTTPLRQVQLPAAIVKLKVTLPRFSEPGDYSIVISRDKAAEDTVARASGTALEQSGRVTVSVQLDLRSARPGSYFLSTVEGMDNGSYYYPLQIVKE